MLCRNRFAALSLASSNAAAAVAGRFAVATGSDEAGDSESCALVKMSNWRCNFRFVVASATPSGMIAVVEMLASFDVVLDPHPTRAALVRRGG